MQFNKLTLLPLVASVFFTGCKLSSGGGSDDGYVAPETSQPSPSFDITSANYLKSPHPVQNQVFGYGAALSGDSQTLMVSAPGINSFNPGTGESVPCSGAAMVYTYAHQGKAWGEPDSLTVSNTCGSSGLPTSLSDDGNVLAITVSDSTGSASVHIYSRSSNARSWVLEHTISEAALIFGHVIQLSGDGKTLAVRKMGSGEWDYSVYVYTKSNMNWSLQKQIKAPALPIDFGDSLSLSYNGNTLAIGATDTMPMSEAGSVYIYTRSGSDWSQHSHIKAANADTGDGFGFAVSLSNDGQMLAVSAISEDSGMENNPSDNSKKGSGAAYIFTLAGKIWQQQSFIKSNTIVQGSKFGSSLSLSGDGKTLAVGAYQDSIGHSPDPNDKNPLTKGSAYIFVQNGSAWKQTQHIEMPDRDLHDHFSATLDLDNTGKNLAVGVPYEDSGYHNDPADNSANNAGAVYTFSR